MLDIDTFVDDSVNGLCDWHVDAVPEPVRSFARVGEILR